MISGFGDGLFFIVDVEGEHLLTSAALHAFCGRAPRSIDGTNWPELVHPDDLDYVRAFCADAFRSRRTFAAWWRILRHDGAYVWAMIGGAPMSCQLSDAPMAYMATIDPLAHPNAFYRAGGIVGPDQPLDYEAQSPLSRLARLADTTLMASALARDIGESDIAAALEEPLRKIGFRLAGMSEPPPALAAPAPLSAGYGRGPRQAATVRRRLASRG